jgi:hypothetical protein
VVVQMCTNWRTSTTSSGTSSAPCRSPCACMVHELTARGARSHRAGAGHGLAMAADLFLMLLSSFPSLPPFLSFSALLSPGPLRFAVAVCTWQTLQKAECATSDTKFRLLCGQCLAECNEYDQCLALLGDDDLQQILPDDSPGAQPHPRRHRYVHAQERERKRGGGGGGGGRESERERSLGMLAAAGDSRPGIVLTRARGCGSTLCAHDTHTHRRERGRDRPYRGHEFAARPRLRHATEPHQGRHLLPRCPPP